MPDIDYMDRYKDFTINKKGWDDFSAYSKSLKSRTMHMTIMLDPAIQVDYETFERGRNKVCQYRRFYSNIYREPTSFLGLETTLFNET